MKAKEKGILILFAFIVWALCGATMGIGMAITTMDNTLIIHAIMAPVIAGIYSAIYHAKFSYTPPFVTAAIFFIVAFDLDLFLVAPVFEGSYDMFLSPLGTWIPLGLIFLGAYVVGNRYYRP